MSPELEQLPRQIDALLLIKYGRLLNIIEFIQNRSLVLAVGAARLSVFVELT